MNFKKLQLKDIDFLRNKFTELCSVTCDYSVGGVFLWRELYNTEICGIFTRLHDKNGDIYYNLPLTTDMGAALDELIGFDGSIRFCTVPEEHLELVTKKLGACDINEEPTLADYIYSAQDLVSLAGKKYAGQRNQISQFKRNVTEWHFDEITNQNADEIKDFFLATKQTESKIETKSAEARMIIEVLDNLDTYKLLGGVLYADGKVAGFSFGEKIGNVLHVHIEKADKGIKGAYQMIVNNFARMYADGIDIINREDDMGDAGLRRSKEAYHPIKKVKKYTICKR